MGEPINYEGDDDSDNDDDDDDYNNNNNDDYEEISIKKKLRRINIVKALSE